MINFSSELKKYLTILPIFTIGVYFLGFIQLNGYLSIYNYSESNFLSFNFLKSGFLLIICYSIIFLVVRLSFEKETMTDNLEKSWLSRVLVLINLLFICCIVAFLRFATLEHDYLITNIQHISIIQSLMFPYFVLRFLLPSFIKNSPRWLLITVFILIILFPFLFIIYFIINIQFSFFFDIIFIFVTGFYLTFILGDIGDNNYSKSLPMDIIMIIILSFCFGRFISKNISPSLGGNSSYKIVVQNNEHLKIFTSKHSVLDTLEVAYQNEDSFLCVRKDNQIININKELIPIYSLVNNKK